MHFRHKEDKDQQYISYICLHEAKYAPQHKKGKRLTNSERDALIEFFNILRDKRYTKEKDGQYVPCNCWQECAYTWIDTWGDKGFFKRDEDGILIMPDYTKLE